MNWVRDKIMKKLLILTFLFISSFAFSQYIVLNSFHGFNVLDQEIKIKIVEYQGQKGFLINSEYPDQKFFFLTDKNTYKKTINKNMINYKWNVWKDCANEMLIIPTTIFCVSSIDWQTGYITFTFNMALLGGNPDIFCIKFDRRHLR
jgi:hypothetical protein